MLFPLKQDNKKQRGKDTINHTALGDTDGSKQKNSSSLPASSIWSDFFVPYILFPFVVILEADLLNDIASKTERLLSLRLAISTIFNDRFSLHGMAERVGNSSGFPGKSVFYSKLSASF